MSAVTTSLSSVLSTTGTAAIPTHSCVVSHEIPTLDAACGVVHSDISDKIMKQCCGAADIVSIDNGCASYCLAQGKDIGELSKCLYKNGFTGNSVYCNKPETATATGVLSTTTTSTGTASTGSSGSTATGTAATTTGTASTSGTGTATGTSATASTTTGAAVPAAKMSTGGVGVLALLFCSALFGAMA